MSYHFPLSSVTSGLALFVLYCKFQSGQGHMFSSMIMHFNVISVFLCLDVLVACNLSFLQQKHVTLLCLFYNWLNASLYFVPSIIALVIFSVGLIIFFEMFISLKKETSSVLRSCGWLDEVYSFMLSRKKLCSDQVGTTPNSNEVK